ncbi:MAG: hypothetical protein JST09_05865 [Bacteroidetes bacterium]|nr:hypothetical protein [Bacteroidota bacterium]
MKKVFAFCTVSIMLATHTLWAQSRFVVINNDKTSTPVSEHLWGSFYELGFGRSDLLWGELLFNRDFELTKPISESNSWYQSYKGDAPKTNWWHSGYQEPQWYISKGNKRERINPVFAEYWPAAHGKYFAHIDNRKDSQPVYVIQDSIYLKKGAGYDFSGLFSNGVFLSENEYSPKTVNAVIGLYSMGDLSHPVATTTIEVNTNQFVMYRQKLPSVDHDGWYSFVVEVPEKTNLAFDQLSLMADDNMNGWKRESIERIKKELHPKTMRMPGGCFASLYNWRSGIGPRELRPVSYDTWWDCILVNDVGTVELADLCHAIGAEPFFCVPLMFNNEFNAADWVDFCNNPNNTQRIAYGHPEPLNVKYWELDNEPYRRYDALTYAEQCAKFAKALKEKDPTIKIAAGNYWIFNRKFKEMLEIYGPYVDLITNRGGTTDEMRNDLVILNEYNKAHNKNIQLCHTEFRAPLRRHENKVDGLNQVENSGSETLFTMAATWEYAMNTVDQYIEFQNMGSQFFTANFTNLSDGWGENLINTPKEGTYLSAAGVVYSLMNSLDIAYPLDVKMEKGNKDIVIQAAWNKERNKLTLVVLNFSAKVEKTVVDLRNFKQKFESSGTAYKIAPPSGKSFNSTEKPNEIKLEKFIQKTGRKLQLDLPAMSLYALVLELKK